MSNRIKLTAAAVMTMLLAFAAALAVVGKACEETVRELEADKDIGMTVFATSARRAAMPERAPAVLIQMVDELPPASLCSATSPASGEGFETGTRDGADTSGGGFAWTTLRCRIYHYCECDRCTGKREGSPAYGITATGTYVTEGRTVAVDPEIIPLGSEVLINGHVYTAEDTGVHGRAVDIYVPDHEQAQKMGTYETIVKWR